MDNYRFIELAVVAKALENLFEHADCIARHLFAISQRGRAFSIPLVNILDLLFQEILYFTS